VRVCERAPGSADVKVDEEIAIEATVEEVADEDVALPGALVEGSR
jgi:hypothetical protein